MEYTRTIYTIRDTQTDRRTLAHLSTPKSYRKDEKYYVKQVNKDDNGE